jgi:hypothetical protein
MFLRRGVANLYQVGDVPEGSAPANTKPVGTSFREQ